MEFDKVNGFSGATLKQVFNLGTITRGDSYPVDLSFFDDETGLPIDMTGQTVWLAIDAVADCADTPKIDFQVPAVDASLGQFYGWLPGQQTYLLEASEDDSVTASLYIISSTLKDIFDMKEFELGGCVSPQGAI